MKTRTMIQYTLGALGMLVAAAPMAHAEQARWGGGFGGGDVPAAVAPAPTQTRWAAGWGGQTAEKATVGHNAPSVRATWAAGWGGEPTREEVKADLAANMPRR
jgi:uncharacterized membrane protein